MKGKSTATYFGVGAPLALAVTLGGCSMASPPREAIATAELGLREAQQSKAPQYAPLELRMASENLNQAKQAMSDKDYIAARHLAEAALVDAQMAESKARSQEASKAAAELRSGIEALRREAERAGASN